MGKLTLKELVEVAREVGINQALKTKNLLDQLTQDHRTQGKLRADSIPAGAGGARDGRDTASVRLSPSHA